MTFFARNFDDTFLHFSHAQDALFRRTPPDNPTREGKKNPDRSARTRLDARPIARSDNPRRPRFHLAFQPCVGDAITGYIPAVLGHVRRRPLTRAQFT